MTLMLLDIRFVRLRGAFCRWGIVIALAAAAVLPGDAQAGGKQASFVIDANTGNVISAFNADEPRYPASLTKMMTLYLVFEQIEQGRLSYQTPVTMTAHAASAQPTKLGLEPGTTIAVIDAIKALVTHSANDVAIALAEHIGGSEDRFAELMTRKARQLGMRNSTFKNASGLPNSEQFSTARDMVTLGLRLHDDFPQHYKWFVISQFNYNGHTYGNHNTMLKSFEGTEGIKTGYTSASGYNLVASVKRGSKHVMGSVFGGSSASSRNLTMRTLLNMALFKASPTKVRTPVVAMARAQPVPEPRPAPRAAVAVAPSVTQNWPTSVSADAATSVTAPMPAPAGGRVEVARVRPILVAPQRTAALPQAAPADPSRGAGPSTLQQQAANLAGSPQPAYRLNGPAAGVAIQIGAYANAAEAERQLQAARERAGDLIGSAQGVTQVATGGGKPLWRARFTGFDMASAGSICNELRRRQIDCMVTKAE